MKRESRSFLDTLADIASQTTPMQSLIQQQQLRGGDENITTATPTPMKMTTRRPRAMSEPWIRGSTFSKNLSQGINTNGSTGSGSTPSTAITLPQMLEKYSSIYNTNGRIGIYTREEREIIISRFHDKRQKRVWVKKIRYHCRKNLADNRVRVKGRFVRHAADAGSLLPEEDEDEEDGEDDDEEGGGDHLQAMKKNSHLMTSSDALSALLFVSERRLQLEREFRPDDNQSNGSGSTSTSTQSNAPQHNSSKRKKQKLRDSAAAPREDDNQASELEEPDSSDSRIESSPSGVPPEEMSLIENVRSRKRMRRHSIAY